MNLTYGQHADFLALYKQSSIQPLSAFICARIFSDEFQVVKTDASAVEFSTKHSALHAQIRSIGVNYNQVVKQLHSNFAEKKALALLYKLENATIERARIEQKVLLLCEQFNTKYFS